jgi:hypothetical protein
MNSHERVATRCVCCDSQNLASSPAILMPFVSHRALNCPPAVIDESWGLKTIPNGTAYQLASSLLCEDCGLLFLNIRFSDLEMNRLYRNYRDEEYTELREQYEPGYRIRNQCLLEGGTYLDVVEDFLKPYVTNNFTVLDWGGDTGKNTPFKSVAQHVDIYDVSGIDPAPGITRVDKHTATTKKYSLIVCMQVLEHTPFPETVLLDIKKAMSEKTILYLEVPNEDLIRSGTPNPQAAKRHWHEHINFFSHKSIFALAKNMVSKFFL